MAVRGRGRWMLRFKNKTLPLTLEREMLSLFSETFFARLTRPGSTEALNNFFEIWNTCAAGVQWKLCLLNKYVPS